MIAKQQTDYTFKDQLIRDYLISIIHEALKMQPSDYTSVQENAASRITSVFAELPERQFPIEKIDHPLELRTAQDYANKLGFHVNHLNRSVKQGTGYSTKALITEHMVTGAKELLQHIDWSVSEIANSLGFDYPTYFNNFFKRITGTNP